MSGEAKMRRATPADRDGIGRLWQEMMEFHRECDPRFFQMKPEALEVWLKHFDECLADQNQFVLAAEANGELVGFTMGRSSDDPPVFDRPAHGFVTNFAVTEPWRRKGVGQRLFGALLEEFRKRGFGELRLSVSALNPASNGFWRRMGFEAYSVSMRRSTG
jgi:ribosomal protein S18 acetylase RimI-like enzyme